MSSTTSNTRLGEAFAQALVYTRELHRDQYRKRTSDNRDDPPVPYLAHLLSVAALVLEHGGTEEEAIAALLHDGPEDQGGEATLNDIRHRFGDRVAGIVAACSDTFEQPKPPWKERKRAFIERLQQRPDPSLTLVSLADKFHNLRSIVADYRRLGEPLWDRFNGGREGTLWYYKSLSRIFEEQADGRASPLAADFQRQIEELDRLLIPDS